MILWRTVAKLWCH